MSKKLIATPSQTVGPFYHFALDRPEWSDLTAGGAQGQKIRIEGRITDGEGAPCPDAFLEIWQADAGGKYNRPGDPQDKKPDPKFRGFGRASADKDGVYRFTTIMPGRVPGPGNTLQAPHVNVTVFARGLLKHLVTRIYFADQAEANEVDPVLSRIEDAAVRKTIVAAKANGSGIPTYRFDVILQGKGETAFFEL
jgi:protocatechuate 3,4-dioxygenase, alpha subunit